MLKLNNMSGGHWGYKQYFMTEVIEDLDKLICQNGKLKSNELLREESRWDLDYFEKYPKDKFHIEYSSEVIKEFKKGLEIIKKSQIYIQRIDYLLSGDDGPESFIERLKEELDENKT